jgi:integrase
MSLSDIIANYIEQQRCLGKRFSAEATILAAFRSAVSDAPLRDIRPDMISRFIDRDGTSDETRRKKYRVVSGLFRFAVRRQLLKASPMPQPPRMRCYSSYTPYIYSEAELKRLLAVVPTATASPRCVIGADTLRTLLLLLYGAGLRRGEALRLKLGDVDVAQSLIHIRGTKFFKTRIVPLSSSLNSVIRAFVVRRGKQHHSVCGESPLFSKRDGRPLSSTTIGATFRRLCTIAGIRRDGGARNQPRMHDLRHSAAVHRVTAWYRCDADLNDLLPKLATYLGHTELSGTQRYLTMTQELLAEASRRFEAYAGGSRHD